MKARLAAIALLIALAFPAPTAAVEAWCGHSSNTFGNALIVFAGHGVWAPPMVQHHRAHYQWVTYGNGSGQYVYTGSDTAWCWT